MWYIELMQQLLVEKVEKEQGKDAKLFISTLFEQLKRFHDRPIPLGALLGIIEKSYSFTKDKKDHSMKLDELAREVFLITIIYSKIEDEKSIYTADFLAIYAKLEKFLLLDITQLEQDFADKKRIFVQKDDDKVSYTDKQKAIIVKLNQMEFKFVSSNVLAISIPVLEDIFWHLATEKMREDCIKHSHSLPIEGSTQFNDFIALMNVPATLNKLKAFSKDASIPSVKTTALSLELEWESQKKSLTGEASDECDALRNQFKRNFLEKVTQSLPPLSLEQMCKVDVFFATSVSFITPLVQETQVSLKHPVALAVEGIEELRESLPPIYLGMTDFEKLYNNVLSGKKSFPATAMDSKLYQFSLIEMVETFLFKQTSWSTVQLFNRIFLKFSSPTLFDPLLAKLRDSSAHTITGSLEAIYTLKLPNREFDITIEILHSLSRKLEQQWEKEMGRFQKKNTAEGCIEANKFKDNMLNEVEQFLFTEASLKALRAFRDRMGWFPIFSNLTKKTTTILVDFQKHPITKTLQRWNRHAPKENKELQQAILDIALQWENLFLATKRLNVPQEKIRLMKEELMDLLNSKNKALQLDKDYKQQITELTTAINSIGSTPNILSNTSGFNSFFPQQPRKIHEEKRQNYQI